MDSQFGPHRLMRNRGRSSRKKFTPLRDVASVLRGERAMFPFTCPIAENDGATVYSGPASCECWYIDSKTGKRVMVSPTDVVDSVAEHFGLSLYEFTRRYFKGDTFYQVALRGTLTRTTCLQFIKATAMASMEFSEKGDRYPVEDL